MSARVIIRQCRADDLPKLEWDGAFSHHRGIFREAFELQRQGLVIMLVADLDGFPVGQGWLDLRLREGASGPMVWAVRIMQGLQGRGIGRRVMAALEATAAQHGFERLELAVEKHNLMALAFYEAQGWRRVRELQESYSYRLPSGEQVTHALEEFVLVKRLARKAEARRGRRAPGDAAPNVRSAPR